MLGPKYTDRDMVCLFVEQAQKQGNRSAKENAFYVTKRGPSHRAGKSAPQNQLAVSALSSKQST